MLGVACAGANDWLEKQTTPLTEATRAQISQGREIIATREPIADGVWSMRLLDRRRRVERHQAQERQGQDASRASCGLSGN
jgi:hypothetical protein